MKKILEYMKVASATLAVLLLVSCEKEGIYRFKGNYSFKTSGHITVVRDEAFVNDTTYKLNGFQIDTIVTVRDEEMTLNVNVESGQMDITAMTEEDMVVSLNVLGGGIIVYYATAEGEDLTLNEATRHLTIANFSLTESDEEFGSRAISADLTVNGTAKRYDNIVLFDLDYTGDFWANDRLYHIVDSDIVCRAKANE